MKGNLAHRRIAEAVENSETFSETFLDTGQHCTIPGQKENRPYKAYERFLVFFRTVCRQFGDP
jgi:hypothetical protein